MTGKQQVGIAQHGGKGVVDVVAHLDHVAPQSGEALAGQGNLLGPPRAGDRLHPPEDFAGDLHQMAEPAIALRNYEQPRIFGIECADGAGVGGYVHGGSGGTLERAENGRKPPLPDGAGNDEVISGGARSIPHVAAGQSKRDRIALGLPPGGDHSREFDIVGEDQDAGGSQGNVSHVGLRTAGLRPLRYRRGAVSR